jgi:hypothetical protein
LCVAFGSVGLQRAAAQLAAGASPAVPATAAAPPSSLVAHNTTVKSRPAAIPSGQTNAASQQPDQTKIVRIYAGAGYFTVALAKKLCPMLAKAFVSSGSDPLKSVSAEPVAAAAKVENQSKVTVPGNL